MKRLIKRILPVVLVSAVVACGHPQVEVHKLSDSEMSCKEILQEMQEIEKLKEQIRSKKGFSKRNVGLALVFWPGILVNESNANQALENADRRLDVLYGLYREKGCEEKLGKLPEREKDREEEKGQEVN